MTKHTSTRAIALLLGFSIACSALPVAAQNFLGGRDNAQIAASKSAFPAVKMELIFAKKQFALGEAVEVTMRYFNGEKTPLQVELVNYDRSGRITDFGFDALDAAGKAVRDPFEIRGGMGGGLRGMKTLPPAKTFEQSATVNEWLAFDRPGKYRVSAYSSILSAPGDNKTRAERSIFVASAPVEIEIVAPDEAMRQKNLDAARDALTRAEAKLATLSSTLDASRRDDATGPEVAAALRNLRWMIDPRAIPLLLGGLEIGGSAASASYYGLWAFPDLAPVRAAIVARLKNGVPVVESAWRFKGLLEHSEIGGTKSDSDSSLSPADEALFNAPLRTSFLRNTASGDTKKAARDAALLLANDPKSPGEAAVWSAFWRGAASLPEDAQWTAALLLLQEKEVKKRYPVAPSDLRNAARDERLGQQLRSATVVALAARGDFSSRPLLARDVTLPTPHFTAAAYATLGDFQAREIATQLLHQLRLPHENPPAQWDELGARVRNFGGGATLEELVDASRWMMANAPENQGPLLEAVALRDADKALVLVQESLAKRPVRDFIDARLGVLVRLDTSAARKQVLALLHDKREIVLRATLEQIESSLRDLDDVPLPFSGERRLRAPRELAESLVPEIAPLSLSAPSLQVRQAAKSLLMAMMQLYVNSDDPRVAQNAAWRATINGWWQKNATRLHRGGVSIHW